MKRPSLFPVTAALITVTFSSWPAAPPEFEWVAPSENVSVRGLAVDRQGNAYAVGQFKHPGSIGGVELGSGGADWSSIFLARLDLSGDVVWLAEARGHNANSTALGLSVGHEGEITLLGETSGDKLAGIQLDPPGPSAGATGFRPRSPAGLRAGPQAFPPPGGSLERDGRP